MSLQTVNMVQLVKANYCKLSHVRKGIAYYTIDDHEGVEWIFPVPLDDVGDGTLWRDDKAILFMRYIRKALEEETFVIKTMTAR